MLKNVKIIIAKLYFLTTNPRTAYIDDNVMQVMKGEESLLQRESATQFKYQGNTG